MIILPVIHCYTIHMLASYLNLALSFFFNLCAHLVHLCPLVVNYEHNDSINYLYSILCYALFLFL